jgi:SAM-dependent methyltransferase
MEQWHENDEFWANLEPILFTDQRLANAPIEVDRVVALAGLTAGAALLDLCCGVGRHTLELARRGFAVTGVDRTRRYLDEAARRLAAAGQAAELVEADMREFCRPDSFDAAVNLFTSFGYFEDLEDDRRVVENVCESLRPGGAFVMDLLGKEILARIYSERDWHREPDGTLVIEERSVRPGWEWVDGCWIILRGHRRTEVRLSTRMYSAVELTGLLRSAGFSSVDIHGDLSGRPYDHAATRLVAVARKK